MAFDNSRTEYLAGRDAVTRLGAAHVAVFGCGGVGGYVCEALARAGVGALTVIDGDTISPSNLNRQLAALLSTVGRAKVDVIAERIADINPDCHVTPLKMFYLPENADDIALSAFDYVADAVDTVAAKLEIACRANAAGIPLISAMGAGNKLYPERFQVGDIAETSVCPLARVMRRELRARGIEHLNVVWSDEAPRRAPEAEDGGELTHVGRIPPGSISFVPSAAGLIMAGKIIRDIAGIV